MSYHPNNLPKKPNLPPTPELLQDPCGQPTPPQE